MKEMTGQECQELAMLVAIALGDEWKYRPPERLAPGDQVPTYANITGPEECTIRISHIWNDANRIQVGGLWPKPVANPNGGQWDFTPSYNSRLKPITCARSRGPAAIAQDIARRYVPKYLPLWRKQLAYREQIAAQFDKVHQAYEELEELFPHCHRVSHNGSLSVGSRRNGATYSGQVKLTYDRDDDQVQGKIQLDWVPPKIENGRARFPTSVGALVEANLAFLSLL